MQTQTPIENEIGNGTPKKSNRTWLIVGGVVLACCCLSVLAAGVIGAFYFMAAPAAPTVSESNPILSTTPQIEALVTASELEPLSETLGIVGWTLIEETPGENRVCRSFQGQSWSSTPNEGLNCIFIITPGTSIEFVGKEFLESGKLFADEKPVTSTLDIPYEHVVYVGTHPNAHTVIDLLVINDGLLYWASVSLGTPLGVTPELNYQSYNNFIDEFLYEVIKVNFSKNQ